MFDPYAGALTKLQLPEGTNVVPPKADNGSAAPSNLPATMGILAPLVDQFDFGSSKRSVSETSVW